MPIVMVGGYSNISKMFPNISVTYLIVVVSIMRFLAIDKVVCDKVLWPLVENSFVRTKIDSE